jgi:sugar porter (SP) family MFS transporter
MLSSSMAFLLFGYDQGVFGGLIATPQLLGGLRIDVTDSTLQGLVVAIYDIGCLIGCLWTAVYGLKFGRRILVIIGCLFLILGAGLQGGALSTAMMIGGRIVAGIGTGINSTIIPVWVSECAHSHRRGPLVLIQIVIVQLGLVLSYWFDYGTTTNYKGSIVWRLPLYFQISFCLLTLASITLVPESPRWLFSHGYLAEADSIIARIYSVPVDHPTVTEHHREIMEAITVEREVEFKFKDVIWDTSQVRYAWRIWICVIMQFIQQLGGISFIAYYASYLFINNLGMSQHQAGLTSGGVTWMNVGGSITAVFTVEIFGRRPVLLWGAVACTVCMVCYTIGLAVNTHDSLLMSTVFIFLFDFCFGAAWIGVPWLYAAEVTPLSVRHVGTALAVGTEWLTTFILVMVGPIAISNIGWKFYILFCVGSGLQVLFVYFVVRETKGLTLEELDVLYAKPAHRAELERRLAFRAQEKDIREASVAENGETHVEIMEEADKKSS